VNLGRSMSVRDCWAGCTSPIHSLLHGWCGDERADRDGAHRARPAGAGDRQDRPRRAGPGAARTRGGASRAQAPAPAGPALRTGDQWAAWRRAKARNGAIPGLFGEQLGGELVYVDSNGDFWGVSVARDTLVFHSAINAIQFIGYATPDCSGSPYFGDFGSQIPPYAHAVFLDSQSGSGILRVRNTDAKLTSVQIQSVLDSPSHTCNTGFSVSAPVLTVADTTIVTQPNIAVSMPLHPVFVP